MLNPCSAMFNAKFCFYRRDTSFFCSSSASFVSFFKKKRSFFLFSRRTKTKSLHDKAFLSSKSLIWCIRRRIRRRVQNNETRFSRKRKRRAFSAERERKPKKHSPVP